MSTERAISFSDPELEDHILDQRARLVGSYRLFSHAVLIVRSLRSSTDRRKWIALATVSVAADLGLAWHLSRSTREHLVWRTAYDALDAAAWTGAGTNDPVSTRCAVLVAVADAIEAAYRTGRHPGELRLGDLRCMLPTVTNSAASAWGRRRRGLKPGYGQVGWGLAGVAMGFAFGRHQRAAERRLVESWRDDTGQRVEASAWLGQHDLAADENPQSPHHIKRELLMMENEYGSTGARQVRFTLEARKQEVRELTPPAQFGDYLGRAVGRRTVLPEGAWSIRLTPKQVATLQAALSSENVDAALAVDVLELLNEPEARRPGGEVILLAGKRRIVLPAVANPARWQGDAAPLGFLFGAVGKLYSTVPMLGGVPFPAALVPATIDLMAAFSYKRGAPTPDPAAEGAAEQAGPPVQAALVSGLLFALLAGSTGRTLAVADTQLFPGGEGLWGHHLVLARYYAHLSNRQRAWALAGSVSIAGTATMLRWIRTGARIDVLSALEASGAAIVPFVAATGVGERLLAQVAAADRAMSEASKVAIDTARAVGVNAEARRFLEWIDAAHEALAAVPDIPEPEAARLRSRFEEARRWLTRKTGS